MTGQAEAETSGRRRFAWRREALLKPARAYASVPARFTLIWDPEGWHVWDDASPQASDLVGVFPTLSGAKTAAEEHVQ